MPDSFDFEHKIIDETVSVNEEVGGWAAKGDIRFRAGIVKARGRFDPERGSASGSVEVTTGRMDAGGDVQTPVGVNAGGDAYAQGPSAGAEAQVGPDGVDVGIGASAGTAGASADVEILGQKYGPESRSDSRRSSASSGDRQAGSTCP